MAKSDSADALTRLKLQLVPDDNERLASLHGELDENLRLIEERLGVEIANRGTDFRIAGPPGAAEAARTVLRQLWAESENQLLGKEAVHLALSGIDAVPPSTSAAQPDVIVTRYRHITPRHGHQTQYVRQIRDVDLVFGIGPAGTGKTYLAVACAVEALEREQVRRLVLVRPAVEAGERLGFLPGDMAQKVDPYLRPINDALYEMLGFDRVGRLVERGVIEIAPLAYMRGRTLNEAFIILDEAQNTTIEQMRMFLTRIGFGSKAVVTGDVTQVDLPRGRRSGLRHASDVLARISGIDFTYFTARDVVRHPLVQRIVEAYERHDVDEQSNHRD